MRWKWSNVPIPEAHLLGLMTGLILQFIYPLHIDLQMWLRHFLAWPAIIAGIVLAGWAVTAVAEMEIASPDRLITSGPYSISRNPMYVAWTILYLGIAFVVSNLWMFIILPIVLIYTHRIVIQKEERELLANFGDEYQRYTDEVPRYL